MKKCILLALLAVPALSFGGTIPIWSNGFETDTSGWYANGGAITQTPSGTGGITAASGNDYAEVTGAGPYTQWGGYSSTFPDLGFITSLDIYLDPSVAGYFTFSNAITAKGGGYLNEYYFIGQHTAAGNILIDGEDYDSGLDISTVGNTLSIDTAGWYTFQSYFFNSGGNLDVDLSVLNAQGATLKSWDIQNPSYNIATQVGGNRYGWFVNNSFPSLAIDNSELSRVVPEPATLGFIGIGLVSLALVAKRRARQ
jgi:hypothetical protein